MTDDTEITIACEHGEQVMFKAGDLVQSDDGLAVVVSAETTTIRLRRATWLLIMWARVVFTWWRLKNWAIEKARGR
jgi:hypothetical protein